MKPIGPLMMEHRLIERMIALLKDELGNIAQTGKTDDHVLDIAIDFFRIYADRCHHGKEEILFRELKKKPLPIEHRTIMDELIAEHIFARNTVERLHAVKGIYFTRGVSLDDITECIETLIRFYPEHIEKEDKHFFFPSLQYLSTQEQASMLTEFGEFDRKLIHEIYGKIVREMEDEKNQI